MPLLPLAMQCLGVSVWEFLDDPSMHPFHLSRLTIVKSRRLSLPSLCLSLGNELLLLLLLSCQAF